MPSLFDQSKQVLDEFSAAGKMLALAESCTGGLIAKSITDHPGSSAVFDRGFVTYSNQSKWDILDVPKTIIETKGAVSQPVARAMAIGALKHSSADIVASVTGISGPGGGTPEKPVGLVYVGIGKRNHDPVIHGLNLSGNRETIRRETAIFVFQELIKAI